MGADSIRRGQWWAVGETRWDQRRLVRHLERVRGSATYDISGAEELLASSQLGHRQLLSCRHCDTLTLLSAPLPFRPPVLVGAGSATITRVARHFGYPTITAAGTQQLVRQALRALEPEGAILALAVDGPAGPAGIAKRGVVWLAKRSGAQIVPAWARASTASQLATWDHRQLPSLHASIRIGFEPAIAPSASAGTELTAVLKRAHALGDFSESGRTQRVARYSHRS